MLFKIFNLELLSIIQALNMHFAGILKAHYKPLIAKFAISRVLYGILLIKALFLITFNGDPISNFIIRGVVVDIVLILYCFNTLYVSSAQVWGIVRKW
jgi:hypothetical protein